MNRDAPAAVVPSRAPSCRRPWRGSTSTCGPRGTGDVDVIGPAFLLDVIAGFGLAVLLLATTVGLFGFSETTSADLWWQSFWVELAAVVVLAVLAVLSRGRRT